MSLSFADFLARLSDEQYQTVQRFIDDAEKTETQPRPSIHRSIYGSPAMDRSDYAEKWAARMAQPMSGFLATLTKEQLDAALAHTGDDTQGYTIRDATPEEMAAIKMWAGPPATPVPESVREESTVLLDTCLTQVEMESLSREMQAFLMCFATPKREFPLEWDVRVTEADLERAAPRSRALFLTYMQTHFPIAAVAVQDVVRTLSEAFVWLDDFEINTIPLVGATPDEVAEYSAYMKKHFPDMHDSQMALLQVESDAYQMPATPPADLESVARMTAEERQDYYAGIDDPFVWEYDAKNFVADAVGMSPEDKAQFSAFMRTFFPDAHDDAMAALKSAVEAYEADSDKRREKTISQATASVVAAALERDELEPQTVVVIGAGPIEEFVRPRSIPAHWKVQYRQMEPGLAGKRASHVIIDDPLISDLAERVGEAFARLPPIVLKTVHDNPILKLAETVRKGGVDNIADAESQEDAEIDQIIERLEGSFVAKAADVTSLIAEYRRLKAIENGLIDLYGIGLGIVGWHLNGNVEPLDTFIEDILNEHSNSSSYTAHKI